MSTYRGRSCPTRRAYSNQRPLRVPSIPARFPACDKSWHGNPPASRSTVSSSLPVSLVISRYLFTSGQCFASIFWQNGSFSTCHLQIHPARASPTSIPPIPLNRLPNVMRHLPLSTAEYHSGKTPVDLNNLNNVESTNL